MSDSNLPFSRDLNTVKLTVYDPENNSSHERRLADQKEEEGEELPPHTVDGVFQVTSLPCYKQWNKRSQQEEQEAAAKKKSSSSCFRHYKGETFIICSIPATGSPSVNTVAFSHDGNLLTLGTDNYSPTDAYLGVFDVSGCYSSSPSSSSSQSEVTSVATTASTAESIPATFPRRRHELLAGNESSDIECLVFSKDNSRLLWGCSGDTVFQLDTKTWKQRLDAGCTGHNNRVRGIALTLDDDDEEGEEGEGEYVASGSSDSNLIVSSVKTGEILSCFSGADDFVYKVAACKSFVAFSSNEKVFVTDPKNGKLLALLPKGNLDFYNNNNNEDDDNSSDSDDGDNKSDGETKETFAGVDVTKDGQFIASCCSESNSVVIWSRRCVEEEKQGKVGEGVEGEGKNTNNNMFTRYAELCFPRLAERQEGETHNASFSNDGETVELTSVFAFSPNCKFLAVCAEITGQRATVSKKFDSDDEEQLQLVEGVAEQNNSGAALAVLIFNVKNKKLVERIDLHGIDSKDPADAGRPSCLTFSPNSSLIAISCNLGLVHLVAPKSVHRWEYALICFRIRQFSKNRFGELFQLWMAFQHIVLCM